MLDEINHEKQTLFIPVLHEKDTKLHAKEDQPKEIKQALQHATATEVAQRWDSGRGGAESGGMLQ